MKLRPCSGVEFTESTHRRRPSCNRLCLLFNISRNNHLATPTQTTWHLARYTTITLVNGPHMHDCHPRKLHVYLYTFTSTRRRALLETQALWHNKFYQLRRPIMETYSTNYKFPCLSVLCQVRNSKRQQVVRVISQKAASPRHAHGRFNRIRHVAAPHLIHGSLDTLDRSQPKRHVHWFSRFCRAHDCDRQTDRQTTMLRL